MQCRSNETAISLKAGCELFLRYATRVSALEMEDFQAAKARMIQASCIILLVLCWCLIACCAHMGHTAAGMCSTLQYSKSQLVFPWPQGRCCCMIASALLQLTGMHVCRGGAALQTPRIERGMPLLTRGRASSGQGTPCWCTATHGWCSPCCAKRPTRCVPRPHDPGASH